MTAIKCFSPWGRLKSCLIGRNFSSDFIKHCVNNTVLADLLRRIADETEEDYDALSNLLGDLGVNTSRVAFDENDYNLGSEDIPPITPGQNFVAVGERLYACNRNRFYKHFLKTINRENIVVGNLKVPVNSLNTHVMGNDVFWDVPGNHYYDELAFIEQRWKKDGFRVHIHRNGRYPHGAPKKLLYFLGSHNRDDFTAVRPGCGVSLRALPDPDMKFRDWDFYFFDIKSWQNVHDFYQLQQDAGVDEQQWIGKWLSNHNNDELIHIARSWLDDWQTFVEKKVLDTNMLNIDENTVMCNNTHHELFGHFRKHKVDPVVFNFRHRFFWGSCGLNHLVLPLYREGTQEDYFV